MKLLENLCDKIDYFFSYCTTIVLSLMQAILENGQQGDISTLYPALADLKDSKFNAITNPEQKLDVCLLIVSSVSFFLILRNEKL